MTPAFAAALAALSVTSDPFPTPAIERPPVRVQLLGIREGRPPLRAYTLRLTMSNPHNRPTWLLFRYWGDKPLESSGVFPGTGEVRTPFGGRGYRGKDGEAVEVRLYGGNGFVAYQLPAHGTLTFEGFAVEAWGPINEVEVWEASALLVDGRTALEAWLPYNTLSGKGVVVPRGADWENLDWDRAVSRPRTDYPKGPVKQVKAVGVRRWLVPIHSVKEAIR